MAGRARAALLWGGARLDASFPHSVQFLYTPLFSPSPHPSLRSRPLRHLARYSLPLSTVLLFPTPCTHAHSPWQALPQKSAKKPLNPSAFCRYLMHASNHACVLTPNKYIMQPNLTSTQSAIDAAYLALACNLPESIRPILRSELERVANVARGEQAMIEHQRRVESSTYNGWANRETWLVGLWWEQCPIERIEADTKEEAIEQLAEQLEDLFHELHEVPTTGMIGDLLGGAVARIEWREIAEHWIEDIELVLPETEEEEANA